MTDDHKRYIWKEMKGSQPILRHYLGICIQGQRIFCLFYGGFLKCAGYTASEGKIGANHLKTSSHTLF